jgi:hypothetical protein
MTILGTKIQDVGLLLSLIVRMIDAYQKQKVLGEKPKSRDTKTDSPP